MTDENLIEQIEDVVDTAVVDTVHAVEEAVDWVEHEAAKLMFEANEGLYAVKTRFADGIVRMLGRDGSIL